MQGQPRQGELRKSRRRVAATFHPVLLAREAGVELRHVAYRGTGPATQDVLAGQIASAMGPEGNFLPHVESRRLRVIALTDVSTFMEQGFKSIDLREWFGFFMPRGTPASRVEHCATSVAKALDSVDVAQSFAQLGMSAASSTPPQLSAKVASELAYWKPILKERRILRRVVSRTMAEIVVVVAIFASRGGRDGAASGRKRPSESAVQTSKHAPWSSCVR